MTITWRILFALLPAVGYLTFCLLQRVHGKMGFRGDAAWYALTRNSQAHAGVIGVFAGFIAAIIVIVLAGNDEAKLSPIWNTCGLGAVATFLAAFLVSILASFQYASFTGFTEYWREAVNPYTARIMVAQDALILMGGDLRIATPKPSRDFQILNQV